MAGLDGGNVDEVRGVVFWGGEVGLRFVGSFVVFV